MRSTAKELRDRAASGGAAAKPAQQAQAEQQLSRSLDEVVDKLGGGSQGEARRMTDDLDRARQMRDRLNQLEQRVRDAEAQARGGGQRQDANAASRGQPQAGQQAGGGRGTAQQQLQSAREEYSRELQRTREALGRMQAQPQNGLAGSTPEQHEFSRSAPGNEAFKQDFSNWERLRKDIDVRLERYESAVVARVARKIAEDRLSLGGSERVPDAYRDSVSRYFESLAKVKK